MKNLDPTKLTPSGDALYLLTLMALSGIKVAREVGGYWLGKGDCSCLWFFWCCSGSGDDNKNNVISILLPQPQHTV